MPTTDISTRFAQAARQYMQERVTPHEEVAHRDASIAQEMAHLSNQVQAAVNALVEPHGNFSGAYDHDITLVAYQSPEALAALQHIVGVPQVQNKFQVASADQNSIGSTTGGKTRGIASGLGLFS